MLVFFMISLEGCEESVFIGVEHKSKLCEEELQWGPPVRSFPFLFYFLEEHTFAFDVVGVALKQFALILLVLELRLTWFVLILLVFTWDGLFLYCWCQTVSFDWRIFTEGYVSPHFWLFIELKNKLKGISFFFSVSLLISMCCFSFWFL